MKKYNRPEIETLALEVIDVIETSGDTAMANKMESGEAFGGTVISDVQVVNQNIAEMGTQWQW